MNNSKLLEKNGWTEECSSPLEIRHEDGSFASGQGAQLVLDHLKSVSKKKKKLILEKDLKNWDFYKSPNGNTFIKFNNDYAIAIGSKNNCVPDMETIWCNNAQRNFDKYTLSCVKNLSETMEVERIGRVKFKK